MPTYFIESAGCIESLKDVRSFNLEEKREMAASLPDVFTDLDRVAEVGITAGASCPSSLVEETIRAIARLRHDELD